MPDETDRDGLVHLYYGPGKGKTTAAMGLAVRASGHGLSVSVIQFMKGAEEMREQYGEVQAFEDVPAIDVEQYPVGHTRSEDDLSPEERTTLEDALETATDVVSEGQRDIVVLDEILTLYTLGFTRDETFADIIREKDDSVELLLTGREAPPMVVDRADYVTYMGNIKHPFQQDIGPRVGIEY